MLKCYCQEKKRIAYDLLDDFARGVEVNEALVYLELITIPSLGTFTTRLGNHGVNHDQMAVIKF
jgi:hypothetical protein